MYNVYMCVLHTLMEFTIMRQPKQIFKWIGGLLIAWHNIHLS